MGLPVAVAGQDGLAGGRLRPAEDPTVAARVHLAQVVQAGGALGQLLKAIVQRPRKSRAGWQDHQVTGFKPRKQFSRSLGPHLKHHPRPPDLGLEHPHEDVTHLVDNQTVPGLPGFGLQAGDPVFHWQRIPAVNEGVHASGVGVKDLLGAGIHNLVVRFGAGLQPETAHQYVLGHRLLSHGHRPPAGSPAAVIFHVP